MRGFRLKTSFCTDIFAIFVVEFYILGRATIPIRGQNYFARIRPLIGMLSGYPRYFGSLLLSLTLAQFYSFQSQFTVAVYSRSLKCQFTVLVFKAILSSRGTRDLHKQLYKDWRFCRRSFLRRSLVPRDDKNEK